MKSKLFFSALMIVLITSALASPKKGPETSNSKRISLTGSFNKVSVGAYLNVVLLNDEKAEVTIEGNAKFIENVKVENINGTLTISTNAKSSFQHGTIYVPVKNLSRVDLMSDSKVVSRGFLFCNNLEVYLSEGSTAELKNKGNIQINAKGDSELEYQKYLSIKE